MLHFRKEFKIGNFFMSQCKRGDLVVLVVALRTVENIGGEMYQQHQLFF
jgi:hypothetical protein